MGGSSGRRSRVSDCLSRPATERRLVDDQLARIEQASQSVLKALSYPITRDALVSCSWPPSEKLTSEQGKPYRQAFRAMQALLYVDQTRRFLNERNTARAAYAAMQAGAFSGDLITDAERGSGTKRSAREGGKAKALAKRAELAARDAQWMSLALTAKERHPNWSRSDVARHIANKCAVKFQTVRRRLTELTK
jgi:hypothetical protein